MTSVCRRITADLRYRRRRSPPCSRTRSATRLMTSALRTSGGPAWSVITIRHGDPWVSGYVRDHLTIECKAHVGLDLLLERHDLSVAACPGAVVDDDQLDDGTIRRDGDEVNRRVVEQGLWRSWLGVLLPRAIGSELCSLGACPSTCTYRQICTAGEAGTPLSACGANTTSICHGPNRNPARSTMFTTSTGHCCRRSMLYASSMMVRSQISVASVLKYRRWLIRGQQIQRKLNARTPFANNVLVVGPLDERGKLTGTVVVSKTPSEADAPGGAKTVVSDTGLFDRSSPGSPHDAQAAAATTTTAPGCRNPHRHALRRIDRAPTSMHGGESIQPCRCGETEGPLLMPATDPRCKRFGRRRTTSASLAVRRWRTRQILAVATPRSGVLAHATRLLIDSADRSVLTDRARPRDDHDHGGRQD